jgi:hypothetical protein
MLAASLGAKIFEHGRSQSLIIYPPGTVQQFDDVPLGQVFLCASGSACYFAVKARGARDVGGVMIYYPNQGASFSFFNAPYFANSFASNLLTLSNTILVPSVEGISTNNNNNLEPGKLYMFEDGFTYLAILIAEQQDRLGSTTTDYLLNMSNGEIHTRSDRNIPIEISRWGIAVETFGKPRPLLTYPYGSPMNFA